MNRTLLLILIVLLTAVALLFAGGATRTLAANATADCAWQSGEIVCTIADSAGIAGVTVREFTAQGTVTPVANSYATCPNEVDISWEPLVPNHELIILDCGSPASETQTITFTGLEHEAAGEATLALDPLTLAVMNFDREEDDGVTVDVGKASAWSAVLLPELAPTDGLFQISILREGMSTPLSELRFTAYFTDPGTAVASHVIRLIPFQPSSAPQVYDAMLYNGDTLVHGARDVPAGTSYVSMDGAFCEGVSDLTTCVPRVTIVLERGYTASYDGVSWTIDLPEPIQFQVPSGPVEAEKVIFELATNGEPIDGFNTVELIGAQLAKLTLYDEMIQGPLSSSTTYLPSLFDDNGPPDPFGFDALTQFMESDPDVGESFEVSDDLAVRVIGIGELIDGEAQLPESEEPDDGVNDPVEPPTSPMDMALRVFNTGSQKEFEVVVSGELLAELGRLLPGTGASPPADAWLGVDPLTTRDGRGLSDGVDNRINLTGTTWWPWRTIAHFSNNCSGVLVGPRHILTAAHCINKRGTNQWYSFTVTPGRNGAEKPYGDSAMNPNPQPGDPFRWYFTPAGWRDPAYNDENCEGSCFASSQWDWGLIIIPDYLGYQTGWMGFVARPASQLNYQAHFNRGYPACDTGKPNIPVGCDLGELWGDTQTCSLGNYSYQGSDGWNRLIRNSCDLSGGHSGSPVYHYFYDSYLGQTVPVAAMVEVWEHCTTCDADDDTPNTARRLTPSSINTIVFFRQWKP